MKIRVQASTVRVTFYVDDLDDDQYVLPFRFDNFLKERQNLLNGGIEEIGGNYIVLVYISLDPFNYEDAEEDAKTLDTIIEDFIRKGKNASHN